MRLRERFTSYEQLDTQFEEMLAGLTNLLEGAAELRRRTHHEVAASLARCEELVARERSNHRQNLEEIQNTLSEMQTRAREIDSSMTSLQFHLADVAQRLPSEPAIGHDTSAREAIASTPGHALLLVIQGVPDVATAVLLRRFVAGLEKVKSIQTREFAGGEFRLEVEVSTPFTAQDFLSLPEGALQLAAETDHQVLLHYSHGEDASPGPNGSL
jgi:hypothetical protein